MKHIIIDIVGNNLLIYVGLLGVATLICFLFGLMFQKSRSEGLSFCVSTAVMCILLFYLFVERFATGSVFMEQLVLSFIITASIYLLGVLKLRLYHMPLLFSAVIFVFSTASSIRLSFFTLYLFVVLCVLTRTDEQKLGQSVFGIWLSVLAGTLNYLIYDFAVSGYLHRFYYSFSQEHGFGYAGKLLMWAVILLVYIAANIGAILLFRRVCKKMLSDLQLLSVKYGGFSSEYTIISIIMLVCTCLFSMFIYIPGSVLVYEDEWYIILYGFESMVLFLQILYLVLLIKLGCTKMQKEDSEQEKQNLILYNSSLEKT